MLEDWLGKKGGAVVVLTAETHSFVSPWPTWAPLLLPVLQLKQLTSLNLNEVKAHCASASAILPQLQSLQLCNCHLSVRLVSKLLQSKSLTRLCWQSVELFDDSWEGQPIPSAQVASTVWRHLQHLPKLSELVVGLSGSI